MSYNQPGYRWYVVWTKPEVRDSRILTAWEYKSDALDDWNEIVVIPSLKGRDREFKVLALRTLKEYGFDPNDDLNWLNLHDLIAGRNPGVLVRVAWKRGYHGDDQEFVRDLHTVLSFGSEVGTVHKSGDKRSIMWVFPSEGEKRKAAGYLLRYHWQDVTMTDLLSTEENPRKNGTPAEHAVGVRTYEDNLRLYAKRFDEAPTRVELIDSALDFASSHGRMWDAINGAYQPHGEPLSPVEKARMDKWDAKLAAITTRLKAVR
jgi:hypothetical protein